MGNGATAQFSISSGLFVVSCGSRTVVSRWVTVWFLKLHFVFLCDVPFHNIPYSLHQHPNSPQRDT
jgi:hypothetical protein